MEVILLEHVPGLGERGDVVSVKDGYARNYLIPRKLAVPNTPSMRRMFENERKFDAKREARRKEAAEKMKEELEKLSLTIEAKVGEEGKLFGSVTSKDIEEELKKHKFIVDRKQIELPETIKQIGVYDIKIKLHPEVTATVKLWVVEEGKK